MTFQVEPFHSSASVCLVPLTVRKPTAIQSLPLQASVARSDPRPADTEGAERHFVPFQCRLPWLKVNAMQLVALPQASTPVQAQVVNPVQMRPRFGETSR